MFHPEELKTHRSATKALRRFFLGLLQSELNITRVFQQNPEEWNKLAVRSKASDSGGGRTKIICIGKAAVPMLNGLLEHCDLIRPEGIVATPYETTCQQVNGFTYFHGGHPFPNQASLEAAKAALRMLEKCHPNDLIVYLISGGGSAAFELPIDDCISLADLVDTYKLIWACGANIEQANVVRRKISKVKGGRLSKAANPCQQFTFLISDVEEHDLSTISSGPSIYCSSTTDETCLTEILKQFDLSSKLPKSVGTILNQTSQDLLADDPCFDRSSWTCLLSNADALRAAKTLCRTNGWICQIETTFDDLPVKLSAECLLRKLEQLWEHHNEPCCIISGGEVRSKVRGAGRGGRNQAFVLECVERIAGKNIAVASLGTDGIDGNSPAAGAIATGETLRRGLFKNMDIEATKRNSDSHSYFAALDDCITTGPTLHNVRDVRLLLHW